MTFAKYGNFTSNVVLAKKLGLSLPTIKKANKSLKDQGLISKVKKEKGRSKFTNVNEEKIVALMIQTMEIENLRSLFLKKKSQLEYTYPNLYTLIYNEPPEQYIYEEDEDDLEEDFDDNFDSDDKIPF
jgi:transposase